MAIVGTRFLLPLPLRPRRMHPTSQPPPRPEALSDVPGLCELPLTRAVVQYRDAHELDRPGGRLRDIGLAVVLEGRFASSVRAIDLGSADTKFLDLSSELVVLDWVYEPTLAHIRRLAGFEPAGGPEAAGDPEPARKLERYCFDLALRILERKGFTPLTRPTLLRIGYRDLCKDLDLHEGATVRIAMAPGELARVRLDYDANALVFAVSGARAGLVLERALREVFTGLPLSRARNRRGVAVYRIRFGVPVDLQDARRSLHRMRHGLGHLVARFEPERYRALNGLVTAFGERETLGRLARPAETASRQPNVPTPSGLGMSVH